MAELVDIMENNHISSKAKIDDCVNTSGVGGNQAAGITFTDLTCDGLERRYLSTGEKLWNEATNTLNNGIVNEDIFTKWSFIANSSNPNSYLTFEVYIPDIGGDIVLYSRDYSLISSGTDYYFSNTTVFYIGAELLLYGAKIRVKSSVGTITLKEKSLLFIE